MTQEMQLLYTGLSPENRHKVTAKIEELLLQQAAQIEGTGNFDLELKNQR